MTYQMSSVLHAIGPCQTSWDAAPRSKGGQGGVDSATSRRKRPTWRDKRRFIRWANQWLTWPRFYRPHFFRCVLASLKEGVSVSRSVGHTRIETMQKCRFWPKLLSVRARTHLMSCIRPCFYSTNTRRFSFSPRLTWFRFSFKQRHA